MSGQLRWTIAHQIRTHGHTFFAENGARGQAFLDFWRLPAGSPNSATARLGRLGPGAKAIAEIAAVHGREFGYDLMGPVAHVEPRPAAYWFSQTSDAGLAE